MQIRNAVCTLKIHLRGSVWECVFVCVWVTVGVNMEQSHHLLLLFGMLCLVKIALTIFL